MNEEEKKRIQEEEFFRHEVRKSLEKKTTLSWRSRIWSFLNSSFGLWLLSTVFVGIMVNFYTKFQEESIAKAKNQELQRKLETEISSRLTEFKFMIQVPFPKKRHVIKTIVGVTEEKGRFSEDMFNIFPEFYERSTESLIYEVEQLQVDTRSIKELKEARKTLRTIVKYASTINELSDSSKPDELVIPELQPNTFEEIQQEVQKEVNDVDKNNKATVSELMKLLNSNFYLKKWSSD